MKYQLTSFNEYDRWAETDTILVPRGELEEETLVGSFTKLLVGSFHVSI